MKKVTALSVLVCLAICGLLAPASLSAATYNVSCSGDIRSAVQGYLDGMTDGDTLNIGPGSCTTSATLSWDNKNITIQGAGSGSTTINASGGTPIFSIKNTTGTSVTTSTGMSVLRRSWALKGMTLTGTTSGWGTVMINDRQYGGSTPIVGWRITDVNFTSIINSSARFIFVYGLNWGLIDHCSFTATGGKIAIEPYSAIDGEYENGPAFPKQSFTGNAAWELPLNLGSEEALYIENCIFDSSSDTTNGIAVVDMYSGSAVVFRYNTVKAGVFYGHSTEAGLIGRGGSRKFEIYNNTFNGYGFSRPIAIQENGTGVIFNNTISGYGTNVTSLQLYRAHGDWSTYYYGSCQAGTFNGSAPHTFDGFIQSNGWPCLDQVGRGSGVPLGTAQPSVPLFIWNNGIDVGCSSGSACTDASAVELGNGCGPTTCLDPPNASSISSYISASAHSNGDKDYCLHDTSKACGNYNKVYTPYSYPHPLQAYTTILQAPSNIRLSN